MRRTGALLCLLLLGLSLAGPLLYRADPYALHMTAILQPPSRAYPLGTDDLGRDALARLLAGSAATLIVALPAALLVFVTGTAYGLLAGLSPAWADTVLMRLLDAMLALPNLVVLIFFAALIRLNTPALIALIGLIAWPPLARLVRNEVVAQRHQDFVLTARQLGGSWWYVARVHLLRLLAPLLIVNATLLVGDAIFLLSSLSFLGLGVQPPQPSWGGLLQASLALLPLDPWWLILPPGLMVFTALLATSLLGQTLAGPSRGGTPP